MLNKRTLERWCMPATETGPFLRPFVARGPLTPGGAIIVGVNPATSIGAADGVAFDDYTASLTAIERFLPIYNRVRAQRGKTRPSKTRIGLDAASKWLADFGFETVLDTNISPYPTSKESEWRRLSEKERAFWVFGEIVESFRPALVLLHGRSAYERFIETYAPDLRQSGLFSEIVDRQPYLGRVTWRHGGSAQVFISRHIRFFGKVDGGKGFARLRQELVKSAPQPAVE